MAETYNPDEHTVPEVQEYLAGADEAEIARVLEAEQAGQQRKGILNYGPDGEPSPPEQAGDKPGDATTTTKAATFQDAAKVATPDEGQGYLGFSPEADRTGRRDKGLSQRNPAVMSGGPLPDPRPGVDDSEALAALKDEG